MKTESNPKVLHLLLLSQIVFRYELGDGKQGTIALDDISFSKECVFDADNNQLPDPPPTSTPPTTAVTPCQVRQYVSDR